MMRRNTLFGSLVFGAVAALGAIPWTMGMVPVLWPRAAIAAYAVAAVALHVLWIAPTPSRGLRIGLLAGLLAAVAWALAGGFSEALVASAAVLGVARSGFLYRTRPARALALEGTLLGGGLVIARILAAPTSLGVAFGFWGFFLVQSLYFLAGGVEGWRDEEPGVDRFEKARRQALALIEEFAPQGPR